uniref:Uncharacterized protein n=1 Tax=Rhizophora mucronata TaxID=61149 RepID=A0A2P2QRN0_RHIMU
MKISQASQHLRLLHLVVALEEVLIMLRTLLELRNPLSSRVLQQIISYVCIQRKMRTSVLL